MGLVSGERSVRGVKRLLLVVVAAVLVVLTSVTPLSASLRSPSVFEALLPQWDPLYGRPRVVLLDRTGLVLRMAGGWSESAQSAPDDRLLVVRWLGGCDEGVISLTLKTTATGFRLHKQIAERAGCPFLVGLGRTVVLELRSPMDATRVQFDAPEGSVS